MPERQKASATENSFLERLAHEIGAAANARQIYGDAVERDGVTVIPVARAVYGFGGGTGANKNAETGGGGGGGAVLAPVGYIEIKNGTARFRPARDPLAYAALAAAVAPLVVFTARRLVKLFGRRDAKR